MIAIVDYGMGNLRSVEKALVAVGGDTHFAQTKEVILAADALVLPGVGAFGDCMRNLERLNLVDVMDKFISTNRPFLGICLGFQCLFDSSDEAPNIRGLSLIPGSVPRFTCKSLKVPHMGWNQIEIKTNDCPLLAGVADQSYVYFVHSYYCSPQDSSVICTTTDYGGKFCSMLWNKNVFATQFHPEKSQVVGLQMLRNFVKLTKSNN